MILLAHGEIDIPAWLLVAGAIVTALVTLGVLCGIGYAVRALYRWRFSR